DQHVYDPRLNGELPPALAQKATATGYLAHGRPAGRPTSPERTSPKPPPPYVLTVLGGGSDGAELARLAAAARLPEGYRHLLITGPQMPAQDVAEIREVAAATCAATTVVRSSTDAHGMIAFDAAVVCIGDPPTYACAQCTIDHCPEAP